MGVTMSSTAIAKVKEIMAAQTPVPIALRLGVRGGGCSGLSYNMQFELEKGAMDKEFEFDGLKVFVDGVSILYLEGCEVDFVETLESSGFKFNNPQTTSCGCGSSFAV